MINKYKVSLSRLYKKCYETKSIIETQKVCVQISLFYAVCNSVIIYVFWIHITTITCADHDPFHVLTRELISLRYQFQHECVEIA